MKRLRRPVFAAAAAFWRAWFRLLGLALRPRITVAAPSGSDTVLVVATHPDDELMGCARAILGHRAAGDRVVVAALTDGRRSRALGLAADEMAARRRAEFAAAIAELGADSRWIGLREGEWTDSEGEGALVELVRAVAPTLIYAPSVVDHHPEHVRAARALARALTPAGPKLEVRAYQADVPLTPFLTNLAVTSRDRAARVAIARAEARYTTQSTAFGRAHRLADQAGALWRLGAQAEVFWAMPAAEYARLMLDALPTRYRGLRARPFGDGLAWLVGLPQKRALALRQRRSTTYKSAKR